MILSVQNISKRIENRDVLLSMDSRRAFSLIEMLVVEKAK
jgi:hypothetical protein